MKKILIVLVAAALLSGCDGKEKDELVEQLRVKFQKDTDLTDYRIAPEDMADCVADKILKEIPGFPGSPNRKRYIKAYTKLVRVDPTQDFRPALEETKEVFGSVAEAYEAAGTITTFNFSCIGDMINDQPLQEGEE
jgi:Prokaryotic membrane lipoprotein lipid attachment site